MREATHTSGVDERSLPRLADTAERGLFLHFQREADHYVKTIEANPKYINVSVDRVAHIDGQLMQLLYNTHAPPAGV